MKQLTEDQWMEYQKLKERKEKIDKSNKRVALEVLSLVMTLIGIAFFYGLSVLTGLGSMYLFYGFNPHTPLINIIVASYFVSAIGAVAGLIMWRVLAKPIDDELKKEKYERSKRK